MFKALALFLYFFPNIAPAAAAVDVLELSLSACPKKVQVPRLRYLETRLPVQFQGQVQGAIELWLDPKLACQDLTGSGAFEHGEDYYLPALLRYVNQHEELITEEIQERPVASLKPSILEGSGQVFELCVDYSIGMGSYNGPISFFPRAQPGRLEWLQNPLAKGKDPKRFACMSSLKSFWKIQDANTVLKAHCRPYRHAGKHVAKSDEVDFELSYFRYTFDGKAWHGKVRYQDGYSDFEGEPAEEEFPAK